MILFDRRIEETISWARDQSHWNNNRAGCRPETVRLDVNKCAYHVCSISPHTCADCSIFRSCHDQTIFFATSILGIYSSMLRRFAKIATATNSNPRLTSIVIYSLSPGQGFSIAIQEKSRPRVRFLYTLTSAGTDLNFTKLSHYCVIPANSCSSLFLIISFDSVQFEISLHF